LSETTFVLTITEDGERLDRYLADALPELSRTAVKRLIESGDVTVDGDTARPAQKVRVGEHVVVHVPPPRPTTLEPENIPLDILYEDADILVVHKAAGMVVHPGAGHFSGTLVHAVLAHCPDLQGVGGELRPGIVHRLDKGTSGALVLAKHDQAIRNLQRQFKKRTVHKVYMTLVIGRLKPDEGFIDAPVGRHPVHRKRMAVIPDGRSAQTRWKVLRYLRDEAGRPYTLVRVQLLTGRTHQIRVHFSWLGYPLVGDQSYGPTRQPLVVPRQFLHARELTLVHPVTEEEMTFTAPLPQDLEAVLGRLIEDR